jgi:hypothetical protein
MVRRKIIVETIVRSKKPGFAKEGGIATGGACAAYRQWCVCRRVRTGTNDRLGRYNASLWKQPAQMLVPAWPNPSPLNGPPWAAPEEGAAKPGSHPRPRSDRRALAVIFLSPLP